MLNQNAVATDNLSRSERVTIFLLWFLLAGVSFLFLANLLVYLYLPTDGLSVGVRRGPIRVLNTAITAPAEIQVDDVILAVDGQTVDWWLAQKWRTWPQLLAHRAETRPTVEITFQGQPQPKTLAVPLAKWPGGAIRGQFLTNLLVGLAYLFVGALILAVRRQERVARLAALIMLLLALIEQNDIFTLLGAEWGLSMLWLFIPFRLLTRWFTYSAVLHFALIFPEPKPWLSRFRGWPWLIHGLNPLVSLAIMLTASGNLQEQHSLAYPWTKNIYIVFLLLASLLLIQSYRTAKTLLAKTQLRWIAWGASLAILPNILLADLPILLLGRSILPAEIATLLLLLVPVSVAVAVLHYRLWEVDRVIRLSLIYGALSLILGLVYVVVVSGLIALAGATGISHSRTNEAEVYFLSALIVALLLNPARQYIQGVIDHLFFRDKLNYSRTLSVLSRQLAGKLILADLLHFLNDTVPRRLNLEGAQVMLQALPASDTAEYERLRRGELIWLYQLTGEAIDRPPPLDQLQQAGLIICAPILSGRKLLGLYGLGRKKSGGFYDTNDTDLIETLTRQAGVAIQNAQLHAELAAQARMERDLEIARQIQLSLLPASDPNVPGLEIVGASRPAQSVGGDFYHYSEPTGNGIHIAVGDVTGKGVPAALLMAVSTSALRVQAAHAFENTAQLLSKMNLLLQSQTRIHEVNVAMLYATIEKNGSGLFELKVSNAGLVSPILLRVGQSAEILDAYGLPMGIIDAPDYNEYQITLQSGDLIVLLSDGFVEAMNERQEMFGFERLEAALNGLPVTLSAAAFIDHLQQTVATFAADTPQHDDMTVVAVRVQ